ncbi:MAG TPA: hypothetical protein VIM06_04050 [Rhodanobacter sp.]
MNMKRLISALLSSLLATSAWAQTASKPLNLKLPPSDLPASSATTSKPASGAAGVYYGDTSGRTDNNAVADAPACDDSKYNEPQVHGSLSTGVVSGNHIGTGTWNSGEVHVTKALGSCDDPTGSMSMSLSVGQGHFNGHGHGGL